MLFHDLLMTIHEISFFYATYCNFKEDKMYQEEFLGLILEQVSYTLILIFTA